MEMLVIGMFATAALVFVAWPLVTPKRHLYYLENMLGLGDQKKLNYLYSKRALVYDNIKDLEQEFEMGKLSEEDFQRLRNDLFAEAEAVVREIDEAHLRREIDELIEKEAAQHRRIKQ